MKKIAIIIMLLFSIGVAKDSNLNPKELETNCNKGDIASCRDLGHLYFQGEGVKKDYNKAAQLWQKACDGGNAEGCGFLGDLY